MVIKKIEQQVNDDYALDESCDLFVSLYSMLRNMESKESPDHRTRILKWALKQLPIKAHSKAVTEHEDLIKASSLLSIEQSLLPYEMGYDLAFGITKENLKYLALKRLNLLPDLSSSKLINEYVKGFWINKDKTEMDSQFWYYFFFPPFRLGKQFNKDLVSSLLNIFKSKSFHDNKATIKYINQLPPSAFIMAFAPPLLRNSFSARWVIYGLNFRETGQFIYSIFGNKTCIPPEFSNFR